jgi:membrane protease YdiL (CAAX protease family)
MLALLGRPRSVISSRGRQGGGLSVFRLASTPTSGACSTGIADSARGKSADPGCLMKEHIVLRPGPMAGVIAVTAAVAACIVVIDAWLGRSTGGEDLVRRSPWILADLVHLPQFLIPLVLIWVITGGNPSRYGFNIRQTRQLSHKRMFMLGLGFGIIMSFRYIIQAARGEPVGIPQPVTAFNVLGHMTFQWIVVGLSEETMFRGFIQTYLMETQEGRLRLIGHDVHVGAVIAGVLWGLFHFINVLVMPLRATIFTVVVTIPIGIIMGYAYQQTRSLLTTIIVHNVIFGTALTIGYLLYWLM